LASIIATPHGRRALQESQDIGGNRESSDGQFVKRDRSRAA